MFKKHIFFSSNFLRANLFIKIWLHIVLRLKKLDEKIWTKKNWGQGTGARHGRCGGKARVINGDSWGAKPPRPPGGARHGTPFQKICPSGANFLKWLKKRRLRRQHASPQRSAEKFFGRKHFRPKKNSAEKLAVRIAEGGSKGGGSGAAAPYNYYHL